MRRRYYHYTTAEVKSWAKAYLKKRETLESLEGKIGISHSTLWWSFMNRLESIDPYLYIDVATKLVANKHLGGRKK